MHKTVKIGSKSIGTGQPCSNSIERLYIGDVKKQSLVDIWSEEEIERLRTAQIEGRSNEYFA
jgi:hypothetical protein